jgi:hypothetical protein
MGPSADDVKPAASRTESISDGSRDFSLRAGCVFQRHAVADLVDLYRQDAVPPRPLAAVRLKTMLLVEAACPAVLLSYPAGK